MLPSSDHLAVSAKPSQSRLHCPSSVLTDIPLDTSISQARLDIVGKVRSNLFPWNGQFSPQLIHTFLEHYGQKGCKVLDPFMGSGTVLVESGRLGLAAFGAEINPAAYQMARAYALINSPLPDRQCHLNEVEELLVSSFEHSPLFTPDATQLGNDAVKKQMLRLQDQQPDGPTRQLLETLIVLLDFYRDDLSDDRVLSRWKSLRATVEKLPFSEHPVCPINCDARSLPLPQGQIDLVVTSPPYINVFNYHQQYRASAEALGWDLLRVARSEIGANRKHRQNRFLTVTQYCWDMCLVLTELRRVSTTDARIIFVVGRESNVLKTPFFNGDIVASIGTRCVGLSAEARQERSFKNKFGATIFEDIIHFRPGSYLNGRATPPADVAKEALTCALQRAPRESISDLESAIQQVMQVQPSPLYMPEKRNIGDSK